MAQAQDGRCAFLTHQEGRICVNPIPATMKDSLKPMVSGFFSFCWITVRNESLLKMALFIFNDIYYENIAFYDSF